MGAGELSSNADERVRVLVADDHPVVRTGLAAVIAQEPDLVLVAQAENGERAVALFREYQPNVVLMDLRMPVMDGVEAVREIVAGVPRRNDSGRCRRQGKSARAFRLSDHLSDAGQLGSGCRRRSGLSSADTLAGWFVIVKDNVGRFAGNKLRGDGWGWSWSEATDPQKTTSTDYRTDCQSCHVPARKSDWIYTRGYPVLN